MYIDAASKANYMVSIFMHHGTTFQRNFRDLMLFIQAVPLPAMRLQGPCMRPSRQ